MQNYFIALIIKVDLKQICFLHQHTVEQYFALKNTHTFKTCHVSFHPSSPSVSAVMVLKCEVLRQYHSTVHRETTAVQNYIGLPRTFHQDQL